MVLQFTTCSVMVDDTAEKFLVPTPFGVLHHILTYHGPGGPLIKYPQFLKTFYTL